MDVTLVQLNSAWEDPKSNFARVSELLAKNPPRRGALVVLPEMFATGFSLDLAKTSAGAARETEPFLVGLAKRYQSAVLAGIVRMEPTGRGSNEAVTWAPSGEALARYTKQRPFSGSGEELVHTQGRSIETFTWAGMTVAALICYDLRFPELFRAGVRSGVDLFVVIAAWPKKRIDHWVTLLRARAIENQAYVVGVNRTGEEPAHTYCGRSIVVDPRGTVVADAGEGEVVMQTTLEASLPKAWRAEFPALADFLRWS